jgi:hypothetical protein
VIAQVTETLDESLSNLRAVESAEVLVTQLAVLGTLKQDEHHRCRFRAAVQVAGLVELIQRQVTISCKFRVTFGPVGVLLRGFYLSGFTEGGFT